MLFQCLLFSTFIIVSFTKKDIAWQYTPSTAYLLTNLNRAFYANLSDSIFILGGLYTFTQIIEYNTITDTYTTHTNSHSFGSTEGQMLAQIGSILYMISDQDTTTLIAYDLSTLTATDTTTYPDTTITGSQCLVAYDNYIVGIAGNTGGNNWSGKMFFYDTTTSQWSSGPDLPQIRRGHSCASVTNYIYVFGGWQGEPLDDIWKYTWQSTWSKLNSVLSQKRYDARAITFETDILIVAGWDGTNNFNTVDVLDTNTDILKNVTGTLNVKHSISLGLVGNIVYVIGGEPYTDRSQYGIIDTFAPTFTPTLAPTMSPTQSPTQSPSISPSLSPVTNPTFSPTDYPTISPVTSPTMAPTYIPTGSPTQPPTNHPTISPTYMPTNSPTNYPTNFPTFLPTMPPTNAPTVSPTRYPTSLNEYTLYNAVIFQISKLTQNDIMGLELNIVKKDIIPIIETNYVQSAQQIEYRDFEIKIDNIKQVNDLYPVLAVNISGNVWYHEPSFIDLFAFTSVDHKFTNLSQKNLTQYFHNKSDENVYFTVYVANEIHLYSHVDIVFYLLLPSIVCVTVILSIAAFIYNKKDSNVDDAQWLAITNVGLHLFDFISDILLSTEIVEQFQNHSISNEPLLYIAGIGSIIFVAIPYLTNIIITIKIETFVTANKCSSLYFKQYRGLFVFLMLFTGSAHCALTLLSSRIFALDIFNSGLTKYELMQLANLRLFGSVLLENLPQLAVQIIYAIYRGNPSKATVLSFVTSFLSVVAAIVSYLLQCRVSDCYVVQYQLEMKKKDFTVLLNNEINIIVKNKECKKQLGKALSAALSTEFKAIEFGFVNITDIGIIVNMIHFVFKNFDLNNEYDSNKWVYNLYNKTKRG